LQEARDQSEFLLLHTKDVPGRDKKLMARKYNLLKLKPITAETGNPFAAPTQFSNVVLIVEGKKLHVNKEFLAIHSPVFAEMFFGESTEKGKQEVE
ncbi:hypothetical protein PMAYCL1PPCAC_25682, partial [Pristionchus mayeri]